MSPARSSPEEAGYTLIELLVVLLLAGFIGVAVAGGLQFGTRLWESSESEITETQKRDTAQTILRAVLASAAPRLRNGFVSFHGERRMLSFDGPPPRSLMGAGLARMDLSLDRGVGGMRLVLRATSLIDSRISRVATLADHLGGLEFSYCDASEKVPSWLSFWRDRDRLPDAVRIEESRRSGASTWPSFVVHLPIAQDATCQFDPASGECRRL